MPYIDVAQPDPECKVIIKSPAHTTVPGCGYTIAAFEHPACAVLNLEQSFMVQFCCGEDHCRQAGASGKRSVRFASGYLPPRNFTDADIFNGGGGGAYGVYIKDRNGTIIKPAEVGPPPEVVAAMARRQASSQGASSSDKNLAREASPVSPLTKRGCDKNSWKKERGPYTRPADNTQIVLNGVRGPGKFAITASRSQTWSSSLSIGFADVISLGASLEFSETVEDSQTREFEMLPGQSGDVGFTAYMLCESGTATCNGGELKGEVCTPRKTSSGALDGIYGVVIHG